MVPRKRRNLWRSIRLTLMDPWEAFGTVALLGTVVAVAVLIGHGRHAPHLAPTGKAVTVQHAPSPQASLDAVLPSITPSPSPAVQAGSPAQSAPRTTMSPSASSSARPASTSRPPAKTSPTPSPTARRPVAVLGVTPGLGTAPLRVTADASGSYGVDAPISSFSFDFGDGYGVGPGSDPFATHTYASAGVYTITLVVTDSAGRSSADVISVFVTP